MKTNNFKLLNIINVLFIYSNYAYAIRNDERMLEVPPGEEIWLSGTQLYTDSIYIFGTVRINAYDGSSGSGMLCLMAPIIYVSEVGLIDGYGVGYRGGSKGGYPSGINVKPPSPGEGPGGGAPGQPGYYNYGTINGSDYDMGSGGGGKSGTCCPIKIGGDGGNGGGSIAMIADIVHINGTIDVSGGEPEHAYYVGGSGSGGSIAIDCSAFYLGEKAFLKVEGGDANDRNGGRIKIWSPIQQPFMSNNIKFLGGTYFNDNCIQIDSGNGQFLNVPKRFFDLNGNNICDVFENSNPDIRNYPDYWLDLNRDGFRDVCQDFDEDGWPDGMFDYDGDGWPDIFAIGRIEETYQDRNGDGIPVVFEDNNDDGIPDGFQDNNRDGVRDGFPNRPPVSKVGQAYYQLTRKDQEIILNGSPSFDPDKIDPFLFFSWREDPRNPAMGLLERETYMESSQPVVFPEPGRYIFYLVVSDGIAPSDENMTLPGAQGMEVIVDVPGIHGSVFAEPSNNTIRLPGMEVGLFESDFDARNWTNPVDMAITSSFGRFSLTGFDVGTPMNSSATLACRKRNSDFTPTYTSYVLVSRGIEESVGMSRGVIPIFSGRILNTNGVPLQGAQVFILAGHNLGNLVDTTNKNGVFSISDVPKGSWFIQIVHMSGAEARSINIDTGIEPVFTLNTSEGIGSLSGQITSQETGSGIPNATVSLAGGAYVATTDSAGNYRFNGIPRGIYAVWVDAPSYQVVRNNTVEILTSSSFYNISLLVENEGTFFFGEVRDKEDGRSIVGATIAFVGPNNTLIQPSLTDHSGYFSIQNVPRGMREIAVTAPLYNEVSFELVIDEQPIGTLVELERTSQWAYSSSVALMPGLSDGLYMYILSSKDELQGIGDHCDLEVRASAEFDFSAIHLVWREDWRNPNLGNNIPDGVENDRNWQFTPVYPGIYTFILDVQDKSKGITYKRFINPIRVFVPGLEGIVCESPSDGVYPIVNADIRLFNSYYDATIGANAIAVAASKSDGGFSFNGLNAGNYWLQASHSNFNTYGPVCKTIQRGSLLQEVEINMSKDSYKISGQITETDNITPIEGVVVSIAPGIESEAFETSTFADGHYFLSNIPRGSVRFFLFKKGYNPVSIVKNIFQDSNTLDFSLERNFSPQTSSLSGTVMFNFNGTLLPLSQVEIILAGGVARTRTNQDGEYSITGLVPGWYAGVIRKKGYKSQLLDINSPIVYVGEGNTEKNYLMQHKNWPPIVSGRLVSENGRPLENVRIIVLPPRKKKEDSFYFAEYSSSNSKISDFRTDYNGNFLISGIPEGLRTLQITLKDGSVYERTFDIYGHVQLALESFFISSDSDGDATLRGDVDQDGQVNTYDALAIFAFENYFSRDLSRLNAARGPGFEVDLSCGDVTGDDQVDTYDALAIFAFENYFSRDLSRLNAARGLEAEVHIGEPCH